MKKIFILVLNCGSSSLKFSIIDPDKNKKKLFGLAECFNSEDACIKWSRGSKKYKTSLGKNVSHIEAISFIFNNIFSKNLDLINNIIGVGHRIVHGGEKFTKSVIIDDEVLKNIKKSIPFAPLHNPAGIIGFQESKKMFPHLKNKNVAVFDTAFHQSMPLQSYLYALPFYFYKKYKIRRYGAHGISHYYVAKQAAKKLKKNFCELNAITCHLGNGGSVTAVVNGNSIDTSMGLTPLEGLVMGTRSGDIDPSIIFYLHDTFKINLREINTLLMEKSGFLGLTETTNDCRYIEENYHITENAKRAMDVYCHRLAKYISAYSSLMEGRLDAIVFTGGIGENSILVRKLTLKKLSLIGVKYDHKRNISIRCGKSGKITNSQSNIPVFVIPTSEELVIAKDTSRLITKSFDIYKNKIS